MVAVLLQSQLGNQMFQLATAYHLAKELNQELAVVPYGNRDYKSYPLILNGRKIITDLKDFHLIEENDKQWLLDLKELAKGHENVILKGYFQSDKYFTRKDVRELFKIPTDIKKKYADYKDKVCISVRRGDYLLMPSMFIVPTKEWIERCYHEHFEGKDVVIASDDIHWCKANINLPNMEFLETEDPIETMFIKSMCKNHIISPSSFAWWSAYLANGKTVAPSSWFRNSLYNQADKYVNGWIKEEL